MLWIVAGLFAHTRTETWLLGSEFIRISAAQIKAENDLNYVWVGCARPVQ